MTKILSIDPGIKHTGVASWEFKIRGMGREGINYAKNIRPRTKSEGIHDRARDIAQSVLSLTIKDDFDHIVIEQPPQTIYGVKTLKKEMLAARAQSVFKVFAAAYAIVGVLLSTKTVDMCLPIDWEKHRGKKKAKPWSVETANKLITSFNPTSSLIVDGGVKQNIADAINIGFYFAVSKGYYDG